jgi:hypothetical protein
MRRRHIAHEGGLGPSPPDERQGDDEPGSCVDTVDSMGGDAGQRVRATGR